MKSGFTLIELLIASALMAVIVALVAKPTLEISQIGFRVRSEAAAATQALAFFEAFGADVRRSPKIDSISANEIVLGSVRWTIDESGATRVEGERSTHLTFEAESPAFGWRADDPVRHILLRGKFAGLGDVEKGFGLRAEE